MTTTLRATILALALISLPVGASSEDSKMDVSASEALETALNRLKGKTVTLQLKNSEPIAGVLEAVGPDALLVSSLSGKEFYSAVVELDAVSAVVYRSK